MLRTTLLFTATALAGSLLASNTAEACRCVQPTVQTSFANNDTVIVGRIMRSMVRGNERYYSVRVRASFKGCADNSQYVIVKTAVSSATCGTNYRVGERYLIMGNLEPSASGIPIISTNSCQYNKRVRRVSRRDWRFLKTNRESCNTCTSDRDCDKESWCRPTQSQNSSQSECTPFATEGDTCGGFTVPWEYERCGADLTCDGPANIPDAPGVCRASCRDNNDCERGDYCATDGLCHENGSCDVNADCNISGNAYTHIMCVGYGSCNGGGLSGGQCGWTCGNSQCDDVSGVNFGMCSMLLGWKIVNGRCENLSGCSNQGYQFFATANECRRACSLPTIRSR